MTQRAPLAPTDDQVKRIRALHGVGPLTAQHMALVQNMRRELDRAKDSSARISDRVDAIATILDHMLIHAPVSAIRSSLDVQRKRASAADADDYTWYDNKERK